MLRTRVRRLGFLVVFVLMGSGAMRGLCFMPRPAEAGPRDAHDCCKTGWTARGPECCMTGAADPARTVLTVALDAPPAVLAVVAHPPPPATRTHAALAASGRGHPPPGRAPLRI